MREDLGAINLVICETRVGLEGILLSGRSQVRDLTPVYILKELILYKKKVDQWSPRQEREVEAGKEERQVNGCEVTLRQEEQTVVSSWTEA